MQSDGRGGAGARVSLHKAVILSLLIVFPGALLRAAPYLDRVVGHIPALGMSAPKTESGVSTGALSSVPSRLSERPIAVLALGMAAELALHIILLVVLLRRSIVVHLLHAIPMSLRVVSVAALVALMTGFLGGTAATFPFLAWRMYAGDREGPATVCRLYGVTRSGAERQVDIENAIPVLGSHRLQHILRQLAERAEVDPTPQSTAALKGTLRGIGRLENARRPQDPLQRLSLEYGRVWRDQRRPRQLGDWRIVSSAAID